MDIVAMFESGKTYAEIGKYLGVSRQRVQQILYVRLGKDACRQRLKDRVSSTQLRKGIDRLHSLAICKGCGRPKEPEAELQVRTCVRCREASRKRHYDGVKDWQRRNPEKVRVYQAYQRARRRARKAA